MRKLPLLCLSFLVVVLAPTAQAGAVTVHCGQTITQSITVDNNLDICDSPGLLIGADNITVNLNGHRFTGSNADDFPNEDNGIDFKGHHGVVVKNGSIGNFFDSDVRMSGYGNSVRNVGMDGAQVGILITGHDNYVVDSTVSGNRAIGIDVFGDRNIVGGCTVTKNGFRQITDARRLAFEIHGTGNIVRANRLEQNYRGVIDYGHGTVLGPYNKLSESVLLVTDGAKVVQNTFSGAHVILNGARDTTVAENTILNAGEIFNAPPDIDIQDNAGGGILMLNSHNVLVQSNYVDKSTVGIHVWFGNENVTLRSNVTGSRLATSGKVYGNRVGIAVEEAPWATDPPAPVTGLTLIGNQAHHNTEQGIFVSRAAGITATGNVANYNGGDGMSLTLASGSTGTLKNNGADYNGGRGIFVSPGFTNLGGNHASANALGNLVGL